MPPRLGSQRSMADAFPKTLFREGGDEVFWGKKQSRRIVHDAETEQAALADGWQGQAIGAPPRIDPLDHDGDGRKGGSKKGAESTRSKGKKKNG